MTQESWTVEKIIDWTTEYFESTDIPDARVDAEVLLAHVLGCKRLDLFLSKGKALGRDELRKYKDLILERKRRKPVSYILGEREFMGLKFKVNGYTLIPRPETELLVEEAQKLVDGNGLEVIVELGTGSGNIAVALAKFTGAKKIYSSDSSIEALRVAQENVDSNGVSAKVTLKHGDLFAAFGGEAIEGRVDLIVSNPPYVAVSEKVELAPEIFFEPFSALFGGEDGLDFYRRIASEASNYLRKGGFAVFEMNSNRSKAIQDILVGTGFTVEKIVKDYSGLDRIVIGKR